MRGSIMASATLSLAACGGGGEVQNKAAAASLTPGQYEVTAEVTRFEKADDGAPKINTPVGTKSVRSVCVGATLTPDLFTDEGLACTLNSPPFARNGILNASIGCTRPDLQGMIGNEISGRFDASSFDVTRKLSSLLSTDGDVRIESHLTARRTGDCQPVAPATQPANNASAAPKR